MSNDVERYAEYTAWLESLPRAREVGQKRTDRFIEAVFRIGGSQELFVQGSTGMYTKQSVIASLACGTSSMLKARVFEPSSDEGVRLYR